MSEVNEKKDSAVESKKDESEVQTTKKTEVPKKESAAESKKENKESELQKKSAATEAGKNKESAAEAKKENKESEVQTTKKTEVPKKESAVESKVQKESAAEAKKEDKESQVQNTKKTDVQKKAGSTILPNKPGEPEFKLKLSPDTCVTFVCKGDKPVKCDMKITNNSEEQQSFKVRCTSTDIFRVLPPMGVIAKGETFTIEIWFQNKVIPEAKYRHYFAVYHAKLPQGKTPKELWAVGTSFEGVRRMPVAFNVDKPNK